MLQRLKALCRLGLSDWMYLVVLYYSIYLHMIRLKFKLYKGQRQ